ncbi:glycosyltransferase family 2 protein, partial [Candidatus Saccharibacteria bacterium]|nr:glycosyltransferase family 2 protein [Candidatus Saccharibacteria bacterium]
MKDKVSIIVPIYNTAKYLSTCLNSIKNQSYENLEIILIDDGSSDDSGKVADDYAKKDSRFKVIHQKNAGQSAARNVGIKKATGKYLGFTDSDDQIKPDFVKSLLKLYEKNHASIAVCGHQYHRVKEDSSENLYQSDLKPRGKNESKKAYIMKLLAKDGRMYSCNNKLFKASIIKDNQLLFNEKIN